MRRSLAILLLLTVATGCTVDKKDPRTKHVGPIGQTSGTVTPAGGGVAGSSGGESTVLYYGLDLDALYKLSLSQSARDIRIEQLIKPMAAVILNQANLAEPRFKAHQRTPWALMFLNSQIAQAAQERTSPELDAILKTYSDHLLSSCDLTDLSGCRNLHFFRRDPGTSAVVKLIAQRTSDVRAYYKTLMVAYELKGITEDPELATMAYARMLSYLKLYVDAQDIGGSTKLTLKKMSDEQKKEFASMVGFLTNTLNASIGKSIDGAQSVEFLKWMASNQLDTVLTKNFAMALNELMSSQIGEKAVWDQFIHIFSFEQSTQNLSYTNALKRLNKFDPTLLTRLGITPYDLNKEIKARSKALAGMMFLNRIFNLRQAKRERYLYNLAELSPEQTLEMINALVKVTMIDRAVDTHQQMAGFYTEFMDRGTASKEILWETIKFANRRLTPSWVDYVGRVNELKKFFEDEIEKRYANEKGDLALKIAETKNLFSQLNPSIKYMVTYPNMIMMGYYAAKANLDTEITGMWGIKIQINKHLVLHDLLEGNLGPMFKFTSFDQREQERESARLDQMQMMWALYFSVAMDLPRLYNISGSEFLQTMFATYNLPSNRDMRRKLDIQALALDPKGDTQETMRICQALDSNTPYRDRRVDLEDIRSYTFYGAATASGAASPLKDAMNALKLVRETQPDSLSESIEVLRSDVDTRLRRLYFVKNAFLSAAKVDKAAIAEADAQLEETLRLRAALLDSTSTLIRTLPTCALKMGMAEYKRRRELTEMEIDYLRVVQTALNTANALSDENAIRNALLDRPEFADLDRAKPLHQALNELLARKSNMDKVFTRIAGYESNFYANSGFQRNRTGSLYYNYRSTEVIVRAANFMQFGFEGRTLSTKVDRIRVNYPTSYRALVDRIGQGSDFEITNRSGDGVIRTALSSFKNVVDWWDGIMSTVWTYRTILFHQASLFKYEQLGELDLQAQVQCDSNCRRQRAENMHNGLMELFASTRLLYEDLRLKEEDVAFLDLFETKSFFNFDNDNVISTNGPLLMYTSPDIRNTIYGFADDVYLHLTSIQLGEHATYRRLRPSSESDFPIKDRDTDSPGGGAWTPTIKAEQLIARPNYIEKASKYYESLLNKEKLLLFRIDPNVDKQIDLFHTLYIRTDIEIEAQFRETLQDYLRRNPLPPTRFSSKQPIQAMYGVYPTLLDNYRTQMEEFHNNTQHVFRIQ